MDILSQSEIDSLLSALSTGDVKIEELTESQKQVEYKSYDFKRPNKFSKDHLRTLYILHGIFARLLSNFLTGYLRSNIQVEVSSVDQLTYEDFIRSVPTPTVLTIFSLKPLKGTAIAQFDPMFLFPMIDLFFGGDGKASVSVRELTEIELSVARKLSIKVLENLASAWKDIVQVESQIVSMETNPRLHQVFSFNEILSMITLTTQVGDTSGFINLCLPFPLLEPVINQLTSNKRFSSQISSEGGEPSILQHWLGLPELEMTVLAGQSRITVNDFLQLQKGDVLLIDRKVDQDMDLYVGESMKYKVQPGTLANRLAVQITGLVVEDGKDA